MRNGNFKRMTLGWKELNGLNFSKAKTQNPTSYDALEDAEDWLLRGNTSEPLTDLLSNAAKEEYKASVKKPYKQHRQTVSKRFDRSSLRLHMARLGN